MRGRGTVSLWGQRLGVTTLDGAPRTPGRRHPRPATVMGAGGARPSWCQHRGLRCAAEQGEGGRGRGGQAWEKLQGHLALAVTVQAKKESTWTREMSRNGRSGQMRDAEGRVRGFRKRTQGVRVEDESGPAERQRPEQPPGTPPGGSAELGGPRFDLHPLGLRPLRDTPAGRHRGQARPSLERVPKWPGWAPGEGVWLEGDRSGGRGQARGASRRREQPGTHGSRLSPAAGRRPVRPDLR